MPNALAKPVSLTQLPAHAPRIRLRQLDHLWFQLTGTLCNLACTHCFISCSPGNHAFEFLKLEKVLALLEASRRLGVKEYYFTGGEPFMHPRILEILEKTMEIGPATVLTNGTLLFDETVARLRGIAAGSIYSLELRVSIDSPDQAENDAIRGEGAFARAMEGVGRLVAAGFLPIITMAETREDSDGQALFERMRRMLIESGYSRPRIKLLPALRIGAEAARLRGYRNDERVTSEMMDGYDESQLLCSYSRMVTSRGVHVCPIVIEQSDSLLADSLEPAAEQDYALRHQACFTCWTYGGICANATGALPESPET